MHAERLPFLLPVPDWMPGFLVAPLFGGFSLADFIGLFVLLNFILFFVMFEIWLERKIAGHIQLRRGPLHAGLRSNRVSRGRTVEGVQSGRAVIACEHPGWSSIHGLRLIIQGVFVANALFEARQTKSSSVFVLGNKPSWGLA